ncbi:hypothetical protein TgHK011_004459 [Trichoderma gracile]|nr:hypothetical protein TgHK011_004459 [Trichoderma gracile]
MILGIHLVAGIMGWDGFSAAAHAVENLPPQDSQTGGDATLLTQYAPPTEYDTELKRAQGSLSLVPTEGYSPLEPLQPDARQACQAYSYEFTGGALLFMPRFIRADRLVDMTPDHTILDVTLQRVVHHAAPLDGRRSALASPRERLSALALFY